MTQDVEDESHIIEARPGDHVLHRSFTFWYMQKDPTQVSRTIQAQEYEKSIKKISTYSTVEGFWQIYNHLVRPDHITETTELHMFRQGIKPIWEDPSNKSGGKLTVRLTKGLASRFWESVLLAIIGEEWDVCDEICGVVMSIRENEDILAIWNRNADNQILLAKLKDCVRTTLNCPSWVRTEYKRHEKRLQRNAREGNLKPDSTKPVSRPAAGGWRLE